MTTVCKWPCDGMKVQREKKSIVYVWNKPRQKANQHNFPKCYSVPFEQDVRCMSLQALISIYALITSWSYPACPKM